MGVTLTPITADLLDKKTLISDLGALMADNKTIATFSGGVGILSDPLRIKTSEMSLQIKARDLTSWVQLLSWFPLLQRNMIYELVIDGESDPIANGHVNRTLRDLLKPIDYDIHISNWNDYKFRFFDKFSAPNATVQGSDGTQVLSLSLGTIDIHALRPTAEFVPLILMSWALFNIEQLNTLIYG